MDDPTDTNDAWQGSEAGYYWPALSFDALPDRIYHFHYQFLPSSVSRARTNNNFFKGVKWSPDGSCFLTNNEDSNLNVFDLPSNALEVTAEADITSCHEDSFMSSRAIPEGEAVYDFCWYPYMVASDPGSCLFATTCRDHPVHLWDSKTGELRCTYRAFDAMDEIAAAYSVSFNSSGSKIFCGYNKRIRVFDSARPGRDFQEYSTLTKTNDGQTGIISCLAINSGIGGLLAAGSYNRTTGLYSEDNLELLFVLHGQQGGVTQLLFSKDGNYLYSGARKDPDILCWDVRNTASVLYRLPRVAADTNQRIFFDIEPLGRHLGTGGQDGYVNIYDLQTGAWVTSFAAALDTVNGFSFHPTLPLAASASGQRRFGLEHDDENNDPDWGKLLRVEENCASVWRFSCTWLNFQILENNDETSQAILGEQSDTSTVI